MGTLARPYSERMHVLVTGGAGFIGTNLCRRLVADGHSVVILDDLSNSDTRGVTGLPVEIVVGSVCDADAVGRASRGVDAIVHLAAIGSVPRSVEAPHATHHVNVDGTLTVLESARHVGAHMIVAGSSSVYGPEPAPPAREGDAARPVSPYAASKLAAESYALAWSAAYGLDVLPFRFFNVFGPWQRAGHVYAAVLPAFVDAALRHQPLRVHGDGLQTRDFTYVGTVVDVIVEALARRVSSPAPVNLAFGSRVALVDVISMIEGELGETVQLHHTPTRPGDVPHSQADPTRLRELFPQAQPVALDAALRETIAWMRREIEAEVT